MFIGGDPDENRRVRELLLDAAYTEWSWIRGALRQAIQRLPQEPDMQGTMGGHGRDPSESENGLE